MITVTYNLSLTMVDTKVCNSLTDTTSAMRCYLCNNTSKDFNNIEEMLKAKVTTDNLRFGLSTLHCWIRCFEFLLHLSHKLENEKWQARSTNQKESVKTRKENIQKAFKKQLGLNVDKPRSGSGNSNDGNTARGFFENYKKSAEITGIDEDIIYRFYVILQTIASGYAINVDNFRQYTTELAQIIVEKFPWYYMPTLVHKLLIHGPEIVKYAVLPIGQMSEDAQEACNKYFKIFRINFARKNYRLKTMEDVFKRFLISSDPYISSCRKLPTKSLRSLFQDTINLLASPTIDTATDLDDSEYSETSGSEIDSDVNDCDTHDLGNENFFL